MLTIYGDILIKVYNEGILKNDKMFRVAFNTAFLRDPLPNEERKSTLEFSLNDLDPSQLAKDDRFDKNFKMIVCLLIKRKIVFEHCDKCNGKEICDTCEPHLKNEDKEWMKINDMIKKYKEPDGETAVKLLFKTKEEDDVDKIMSLRTAADKDI
jgi:phosphatidylinositol-3,4,5-trisphosphate 3-phosphatase/dual-specificity protein phosphatase PTEN